MLPQVLKALEGVASIPENEIRSREDVIECEKKLGSKKLPLTLLRFVVGGGFPMGVGVKNPQGHYEVSLREIGNSKMFCKTWGMKKDVALFCGDGHVWIGVNLRASQGDDAPIVYISNYGGSKETQIADNFDDLLTKLCIYEDEAWEMEKGGANEDDENIKVSEIEEEGGEENIVGKKRKLSEVEGETPESEKKTQKVE